MLAQMPDKCTPIIIGTCPTGEHGPLDFAEMGDLGRACDIWGMTALARVQKSCDAVDENTIYRTLDRGS
eukprot:SAG31_NODE_534_length_14370_cov_121.217434_7_plen_69_part_00